MIYKKVTTGFVIQYYKDDICTRQEFCAGDIVNYGDVDGLFIDPPENEVYQPFDMVQPDKKEEGLDYYVVMIWGCVEPQLYGPYSTPEKQQTEIDRLRAEQGEDENTFFVMNVTKGAKLVF